MIKYSEMVSAAALTATATSYYTAPAATFSAIHAVSAVNPTGAPVTVNIYRVPSGNTASTLTRIASRVVPANTTVSVQDAINHKLAPASQLFADGLGCSLNVSGVEFVPNT